MHEHTITFIRVPERDCVSMCEMKHLAFRVMGWHVWGPVQVHPGRGRDPRIFPSMDASTPPPLCRTTHFTALGVDSSCSGRLQTPLTASISVSFTAPASVYHQPFLFLLWDLENCVLANARGALVAILSHLRVGGGGFMLHHRDV